MKKIDTTQWHEFLFTDLFEIKKGTRLTKADMKPGDINYIGASAFNNGITAKIGNNENIHPAGTLTVCYNGSVGETFFQTEPFWATDDVNVLYPNFPITFNIAKFLCVIINKVGQNYAFIDKWTAEKMANTLIKLPSTANQKPDWMCIENYMKQLEKKVDNNISMIDNVLVDRKIKVNTPLWHKFRIGTLFPNIIKPEVYHTYQVEENIDGIPYVVRKRFNNGMKYRVSKNKLNTNPAGVISFGAENSKFFYQDEEWCSGRDMYYIDTRTLSSNVCRFLATCLYKITRKYSYNYGLFPELLKDEYISLPTTEDNQPDWEFMENYMQEIEEKVNAHLDHLKKQVGL